MKIRVTLVRAAVILKTSSIDLDVSKEMAEGIVEEQAATAKARAAGELAWDSPDTAKDLAREFASRQPTGLLWKTISDGDEFGEIHYANHMILP